MNLDFTENYILENDCLLLRPLQISDKELLIQFAINEPEIWRYNINGGNGIENFNNYFDFCNEAIKRKKDGNKR